LDTARQERLNVHLALVLSKLGLHAQAELVKSGRKSPDLLIYHPLLGAFLGEAVVGSSWDDERARRELSERATERLSDQQFNIIDGILLVIYPRELLRESAVVSEEEVERLFERYPLGMGLAWRLREPLDPFRWTPQYEWLPQPVLAKAVPVLFEEVLRQKAFMPQDPDQVVRNIEAAIEQAAQYCSTRSSEPQWLELWRNVAHALEIDFEAVEQKNEKEAVRLTAKTFFMLLAISILVYEVARIRYPDPEKLPTLSTSLSFNTLTTCLEKLKEINYVEVVEMVLPSLRLIPEDPILVQHLRSIRNLVAEHLTSLLRGGSASLAALYQGLLSETYRSAYATFFTKMPAAQLLSELAVNSWDDRVIDPACGTGSLLVSTFLTRQRLAVSSVATKSASHEEAKPVLDAISERLLDNTYGADALRVATALTSASLTVVSRGLKHERLKVVHTPVGRDRAGSLDLLTPNKALIPSDLLRDDALSLVIMNPPFTRSDRISQLIGDEARRSLIGARLTFGGEELQDVFTAGMSKPFLALADRLVQEGGRIAAVLPNSLLSRPSWRDVRRAIAERYTFRYLVVSWAEGTPNFSSDTEFREILAVLEKKVSEEPLTVIHLLKPVDDLKVSDVIKCASLAKEGDGEVNGTDGPIARVLRIPQKVVRTGHDNLYRLVAFLDDELTNWHLSLIKNCVPFSRLFGVLSVIDHTKGLKVVEGPFDPDRIPQGRYPAVWGSGWEKVRSPVLQRIPFLIYIGSRKKAKIKFWNEPANYQSRLFVLRRGQLDTQGVIAVGTKAEAVSNVWWPIRKRGHVDKRANQLFLAFMNSSFGFLHMLAERLETRGLWLEYKKEHLQSLPIPDFTSWVKEIPKEVLSALEREMPRFDRFLSGMSIIEHKTGSWDAAAKHVLQDPGLGYLAPRAELDLFIGHELSELYGLRVPSAFYSRLNKEVERLRRIMDSRSMEFERTTEDIGVTKIKLPERKEAPLESYDESSSTAS
jgi:hypothetical protein